MKKLLYIIVLIINCQLSIVESQWVQQTVPVTKPITGIKFINANTGWACTEIGTGGANYCYILVTINGGTNWFIQDSTFDATYGAINMLNNSTGYCGGADFATNTANLKKTTNGGVNWVVIPTPTNMAIGDMQFLNQDSGWSCSQNIGADVRTTTNGGVNWIVRTSGIAAQTQKIFFLSYSTGFCGANSNLYKTTNAGLNWNILYNPSSTTHSIFFLNEQTGWIGITNNRIRYTSNAGGNWVEQTISPPSGPIYALYFFNQNTGWAGVGFDYIFKTTNGGNNWGYQNVSTGSKVFSFVDTSYGWCGNAPIGFISKTTNGGGIITYNSIQQISNETPVKYELGQNYPNPFNPSTKFKFQIPEYSYVKVIIYDALGRTVKTEADNFLKAGTYLIDFNGSALPSGVYFYKLITGGYTETKKMLLVK